MEYASSFTRENPTNFYWRQPGNRCFLARDSKGKRCLILRTGVERTILMLILIIIINHHHQSSSSIIIIIIIIIMFIVYVLQVASFSEGNIGLGVLLYALPPLLRGLEGVIQGVGNRGLFCFLPIFLWKLLMLLVAGFWSLWLLSWFLLLLLWWWWWWWSPFLKFCT